MTYSLDKVIRPLNNWGQIINSNLSFKFQAYEEASKRAHLIGRNVNLATYNKIVFLFSERGKSK